MFTYRLFQLSIILILTAILFSLAFPQSARADEGGPAEPTPAATQDSPTALPDIPSSNNSPTAEPPAETLVTSETPATDEPTVTETIIESTAIPTEEPPAQESPVAELLATDTPVIVLDSTGQPEPLATQEAAEIIATGDPMWCPAGVAPGGLGCTSSYASFSDLVAAILTGGGIYGGDGTIYITQNYDSSADNPSITLDDNLNYLGNLVVQGGWNGVFGNATVIGQSTFNNTDLFITNWNGNLTLNNLVFANAGIAIDNDGNVSLNNVDVTRNDSDGVSIASTGSIELNNISSDANAGNGIIIDSGGHVFAASVDISNNAADGLIIHADGDTTLNSVTANNNGYSGITILSNGNVIIDRTQAKSNGNNSYGLWVENLGSLLLTNGSFWGNQVGAYVDSGGSVFVGNSSFMGCAIDPLNPVFGCQGQGATFYSGESINIVNSQFNGNFDRGLAAIALENVSLNNVVVNGNEETGALLAARTGDLTICDSQFLGNGVVDLQTAAGGSVNISSDTQYGSQVDLITPTSENLQFNCSEKKVNLKAHIVEATEGVGTEIDCDGYGSVVLYLPTGESLVVPCPMRGKASLSHLAFGALPQALPNGYTFISALLAQAARDGLTLSFAIPEEDVKYSILFWNGSSWVELDGASTVGGFIGVSSISPGFYVLATK